MTVSISKMSINYYLENAATGDGATQDMTSYYTEAKAPAGTWFGAGLSGLPALTAGQEVTEWDARHIYEHQTDPATGEQLGRPAPKRTAAPSGAKTPKGETAKDTREGVAGFDLTFSPPKSVSALWAIAGPELQGRLHQAHRQATEETLRWVETNIAQSRAGHGGVAHVPVTGIVGSLFDHWDSRAGDPQLHTHAVIANRVQRASDGQWVTLDSYTLHRHVVAISETYNSVLFDRLAEHVGAVAESRSHVDVDVEALLAEETSANEGSRPEQPAHRVELTGVPDRLLEEFSTRSAQIEARTEELITRWTSDHGTPPSARDVLRLRQQATLENRPSKDSIEEVTLSQKMASWRRRALQAGVTPEDVIRDAVGREPTTIAPEMLSEQVISRIGTWALADASQRRTTFSRANVHASVERVMRLVRCGSVEHRLALVDQALDAALTEAVALTPQRSTRPETHDPTVNLRGGSVFDHRRHAGVYTTAEVLDDESHLIHRVHTQDAPALTDEVSEDLSQWRSEDGHPLSSDQYASAQKVLTSTAGISAMIGPAGTGKTTTMSAITDAWQNTHGESSVIGLAPSAVAATVLGDEIGVETDNVSKWLYETVGEGAARRAGRVQQAETRLQDLESRPATSRAAIGRLESARAKLASEYATQAKYTMRPGQLLIIDEASMVSTAQLAALSRQAETAGAKVLLVGDPAQLEAVEAGGFLGHVERHLEHTTLTSVWRFKNEWEKKASLNLRRGETKVLTTYDEAGRLHGDPDIDPADAAYTAWKADRDAGQKSILIAPTTSTVAELNARAHHDLVESGEVDIESTVEVRDEALAGVGEVLLARKNNRQLRDSAGEFIANGTRLTVEEILPDGAVHATVESNQATITLDPDYLRDSVELGYACTAHRAQGVTVDTSHAVAAKGLSRELFYVSMTRGKHANHAYVDLSAEQTHSPDQWELLDEPAPGETPIEALEGVLSSAQAERSAHERQDAELGWANDLGRLCHEASYLDWAARTTRTQKWVEKHYSPQQAEALYTDHRWPQLVHADPAQHHQGQTRLEDTIKTVIERCPDPGVSGVGPGNMLPAGPRTTPGQQDLGISVEDHLEDQLNARLAVVRRDHPSWLEDPALSFDDEDSRTHAIKATLIWRAVSDQTENQDAFGVEPKQGDYLRPYWDRLQTTLSRTSSSHGTSTPGETDPGAEIASESLPPAPEELIPDVDWTDFDDPEVWALDDLPAQDTMAPATAIPDAFIPLQETVQYSTDGPGTR